MLPEKTSAELSGRIRTTIPHITSKFFMRYQVILFDLDGTLLNFEQSERESLAALHNEFYSSVCYKDFLTNFHSINQALWCRVGAKENVITPRNIGESIYDTI